MSPERLATEYGKVALRFPTTLAAMALLVAAGLLVALVGMYRGSPGDAAYASDPGGTPIPLENPRIPRTDIAGPGPLLIPPERADSSSPAGTAAPILPKSTGAAPHTRFPDEKEYMLGLINAERRKAGVPDVSLGDNNAAQIHTENAIRECVSSHWGTDGLVAYMRYSLAGGHQSNGENASGYRYCLTAEERPSYRPIQSIESELRRHMDGLMGSPGHRDNILDPWHRKVNLGIAWDTHQMWNVQHFEGDYVDCSVPPTIEGTTLRVSCTAREVFPSNYFAQQIFYDPPPHALTRGQLARGYSYGYRNIVAWLREQPGQGYVWTTNEEQDTRETGCTPYDVDPALPPPSSFAEATALHNAAKDCEPREETVTVPWITGEETISGRTITLSHDIGPVLREHGNGVYTLLVWGCSVPDSRDNPCEDDNSMVIIEKSIFYGIDPPDTYSPDASSPTPTPTPTPTATPTRAAGPSSSRMECGAAVADKSNTGLVSDCEALLAAKDILRGTAALNWTPSTAIARWDGITLGGNPQRVTKILLQKRGLTGSIPAALGRLDRLEELWLYTNGLTGSIPPDMGNLSNLTWLFVADNNLSGQIPESLNNLTLDRLWLHKNGFTGCVPYNLTLTREYKVDPGLPACAQPTGQATPTPTPALAVSPTPTPSATPITSALDDRITWHIHCQESDFVAAFGEKYVMDDERTWHSVYDRNGRGLWHVLRTIWQSPSSPDRSAACMTKVYDNLSSAIWDHQYTTMLEEALGGSDVLRQHKRCCKEIGVGFKGLMLDIGSTFSDGRWQDTLTSKSGVASFRRGQVIIRIASYDRRSDGGYHLLEVDEMARRVNSRFYEGIFDEIETRSQVERSGKQNSIGPGNSLYLNPWSPDGQ